MIALGYEYVACAAENRLWYMSEPPLVLILCGQCGAGKSSTCNTLLGRDAFDARRSVAAVTMECRSEETFASDGRRVVVLDTPGLTDPEVSQADLHQKIIDGVKAMECARPGSRYAVILVASLAGRLDDGVLSAFSALGMVFGRNLYNHAVVLWTHGDLLSEPASPSLPLPSAAEQVSPPNSASGTVALSTSTVRAMESALASYLSEAGEAVTSWLSSIRGGSLVMSNQKHLHEPGVELERLASRAVDVSGSASQLAPPKPHRKQARRERQQAMLAGRHGGSDGGGGGGSGGGSGSGDGSSGNGDSNSLVGWVWTRLTSYFAGADLTNVDQTEAQLPLHNGRDTRE